MNYRTSIALFMLFVAGPAFAHGELPTIEACRGYKPVYLGTFGYIQKGLRDYQICLRREAGNPALRGSGGSGGGSPPPICLVDSHPITMVRCPAQVCGEFDDDYSTARALALAACTAYVGEGTDYPDGGLVVPLFNGPASFLSTNHHQAYEITEGITGVCALCPDDAP
jgi:hypothetical protein